MNFLQRIVDERFLEYRLRSSSTAGMAGALFAWAVFMYRLIFEHTTQWDLVAVIGVIAAVKLVLMAFYFLRH